MVEEFQKYRAIPQIRDLMARSVLCSLSRSLYISLCVCVFTCVYHSLSLSLSVCVLCVVCVWYRLQSIQVDLGQQIKVDFERAFSTKGTPVSVELCLFVCVFECE